MDKCIYDENNGLWYELVEGYYSPCLTLPPEENKPIGIWEQRHLRYIKQHKSVFYINLLTFCKLNSYLSNVDEQAENMFSRLVKEMSKIQKINEQLKEIHPMAWVGKMNNICNAAIEVVNKEIIFA